MPDRCLSTATLLAFLAAALGAQPGNTPAPARPSSQPSARPSSQQPPIKTGVNLVRVDVYPTASGGVAVMDLKAADFEVLEDGASQRLETFEHVVIQPAGPQSARRDPSSQNEMLQAAANPRSRVFVIFLDTPNVSVEGAHRINEPLIRLIDRVLGPDDLVGVMTPAMAASQLVLGRKTDVIEESLRRNWPWGSRSTFMLDEREQMYEACYPKTVGEAGRSYSVVAWEMIRRKRERATLEALQDLVTYLHAVREERKAILTVTEGWLRFKDNPEMMNLRSDPVTGWQEPVPGRDPVVVGPTGQPTLNDPRRHPQERSRTECDADRLRLATMDNDQFFRDLLADANRANASFYPIDPRGLAVFDTAVGPHKEEFLPPVLDGRNLRSRQDAMYELAANTDGIAVLNNNDLDAGLKRISDDLTSYYLLGYNSTNTKLDGTFREIRVRVKRPGVQVRARRGYRAATVKEATAARRSAGRPDPGGATSAFTAAMSTLGRIRPDATFRVNAATMAASGVVWVAGEIVPGGPAAREMSLGATADVEVAGEQASGSARVQLKPGERTFLTSVTLASIGSYVDVRVRLVPEVGTALTDAVRLEVGPVLSHPLLFRRGLTTANRMVPAADFRFSRTERLRIEVPAASGSKPVGARLMDRAGNPLDIPVAATERLDESSGQLWIAAEMALAPLAPSDYAIEVSFTSSGVEQRVLTAIRLGR
jgi:VWFA-related protein